MSTFVLFCTFVLFLFGNGCGRSRSTCMQNLGLLAQKMAGTVQTRAKALKYLSLDNIYMSYVLCLQVIIQSKLKVRSLDNNIKLHNQFNSDSIWTEVCCLLAQQ